MNTSTFTRADLSAQNRALLDRYAHEMRDFDNRSPQYAPKQELTAAGVALLLRIDDVTKQQKGVR